MVLRLLFTTLALAYSVSSLAVSPYPKQLFDCAGEGVNASILLTNSVHAELISKSANPYLKTIGHHIEMSYQGYYNREFTTFSTNRRANGTYIEFVFSSSDFHKVAREVSAKLKVIQKRKVILEVPVICSSSVN